MRPRSLVGGAIEMLQLLLLLLSGLGLVLGLGLVIGLVLGLMLSSDIVLKSTVLSPSCVPTFTLIVSVIFVPHVIQCRSAAGVASSEISAGKFTGIYCKLSRNF